MQSVLMSTDVQTLGEVEGILGYGPDLIAGV